MFMEYSQESYPARDPGFGLEEKLSCGYVADEGCEAGISKAINLNSEKAKQSRCSPCSNETGMKMSFPNWFGLKQQDTLPLVTFEAHMIAVLNQKGEVESDV